MLRNTPTQYKLADKAITLLNKRAIRRFNEAKSKLSILKFDELNVVRQVKTLYELLTADNQEVFLDLAQLVYERTKPHGKKKPDLDWLMDILMAYNETTLYVYENEVQRKREYTTESIIAAHNKPAELNKGLYKWSRFTTQYADIITDEATLKAFKDGGVKRVRWNTEEDAKVCHICDPLDGKVFEIEKAPPKQHWHCRCWLTPAD